MPPADPSGGYRPGRRRRRRAAEPDDEPFLPPLTATAPIAGLRSAAPPVSPAAPSMAAAPPASAVRPATVPVPTPATLPVPQPAAPPLPPGVGAPAAFDSRRGEGYRPGAGRSAAAPVVPLSPIIDPVQPRPGRESRTPRVDPVPEPGMRPVPEPGMRPVPARVDRVRPRTATRPAPGGDDDAPDRHHSRRWFATLSVVGVLVLLAVCALGTYFMVKDERPGTAVAKQTAAAPPPKPRDISNRTVDPTPLTEQELFPQPQLTVAGSGLPYQVLKTQASPDCKVSATDDLGTQLVKLGCNQVVRATLKSPNGQFLVTAGIFNFPDESSANQAYQALKPTVDAQKGHLLGLLAGPGTDPIIRAPTHLGWFVRGHFMAFCVIARVDGKAIPDDDPYAQQIATDLVETHLRDGVIGARAVQHTAGPSGSPSAGR
jgi:hypothetical protein